MDNKEKHNCQSCAHYDVCEWAIYKHECVCDTYISKHDLAKMTRDSSTIDLIKNIMNNILMKKDIDGHRPIKNTSRKDCYEALYEIQYLLRRSEQCHGGFTHE